ncbi:MAG: membrane protein [Melioribacteraceae bacterium]|nr:MAG: membrane protein [Melioribacteraceae bacterium]
METDSYFQIIILSVLLLLSAFFSGSEVALFSIDKKRLKELKKDKGLISNYILSLLENPRRLLVTILLGNTVFNVAASITSVAIALDIADSLGWNIDVVLLIQIIALTILILIFGEITPKVWASKHPAKFARLVAFPLYWTSVFIYPVSKLLTELIKSLSARFKFDKSKTAILTSELTELADLGIEKGTIEEDEHGLIHGLVAFKSVSTREVMTPRVDITSIAVDTPFDEVMRIITESGHSRIPLFEENLDNITGIIYAKDLLPYISDMTRKNELNLRKIARKAYFVPETKLINELMHEFQEKNLHLGIVVDEYGGTSGLVSLEDILEEIVGEIRDEYDNEENEITKLGDNSYMVLGKIPIDELNDFLEFDFSSENDDYDTLAGFIYNLSGSIPENNYSVNFDKYRFTVKEVINKRINKVLIEVENTELSGTPE